MAMQVDVEWTNDDEGRVYALGYASDMPSWGTFMIKYVGTASEIRFLDGVHPEVASVLKTSGYADPADQANILKVFERKGMYKWWNLVKDYDIGKALPFRLMLR